MHPQPPPDTTRLLLIRHGATEANERKPYILQGCGLDGGLSASGRAQAEALGRFLSSFAIAQVYSSPLRRAQQTAQAIAQPHGIPVESVAALIECNVGRWEGQDWETIMASDAEAYRTFVADPAHCPHPGGESYLDVLERAEAVLQDLLQKHLGSTVVVVAHNMVNRVYLARLLGIDLKRAREIRQLNAGINVLQYRNKKTQVVTLNSAFHLPQADL